MDVLDKVLTLADARAFMIKALSLLDNIGAWESGAHLDQAIRILEDAARAPPEPDW